MLPDYPQLKDLILEDYRKRIDDARQHHLGPFAEIKHTRMHEGVKCFLQREDGSEEETEMQKLEALHSDDEFNRLSMTDEASIANFFDKMGEKMASQQAKLFIQRMDESVREVGNVGTPGQCMVEQILEMWDKQAIEFDAFGNPKFNTFIAPSNEMIERIKAAIMEIDANPALRHRKATLLQKKKREWDDREAARNLVE